MIKDDEFTPEEISLLESGGIGKSKAIDEELAKLEARINKEKAATKRKSFKSSNQ